MTKSLLQAKFKNNLIFQISKSIISILKVFNNDF